MRVNKLGQGHEVALRIRVVRVHVVCVGELDQLAAARPLQPVQLAHLVGGDHLVLKGGEGGRGAECG